VIGQGQVGGDRDGLVGDARRFGMLVLGGEFQRPLGLGDDFLIVAATVLRDAQGRLVELQGRGVQRDGITGLILLDFGVCGEFRIQIQRGSVGHDQQTCPYFPRIRAGIRFKKLLTIPARQAFKAETISSPGLANLPPARL
jgi:hypothetical protein